ncbi:hypothetical protein GTW25_11950 [Aliihoeflea aestuarii]|jgi:2-keto-4-pentenoate hydratase|uniref:hypothetical protein n=1 Tax=Aliihoeflea aestuarii TaxID=453840 RepID=UPI002093B460|nr:hypothetical protein [Aliihoeflea aestuarii]MCO6391742.1 hypothetical protein [Aliihoeflea aestuarii]
MDTLSTFTEALIDATRSENAFVPKGRLPKSVDEAYAVQDDVAQALQRRPGAWKTSRQPNADSLYAPIPQSRCFSSGGQVSCPGRIGVELEIGWKILDTLPALSTPDYQEALRLRVAPFPVIELVHSRIEGALASDPFVKLADGMAGHSLVSGEPQAAIRQTTFGEVAGQLLIDDEPVIVSGLKVPGGDALATLAEFLAVIGNKGIFPIPGQIVITGSLHPMVHAAPGARIAGRLDGLGTVEVKLAAQ